MFDDLTAVLLCGGKGTRLRPFTEDLPKPLVPLNGRPLLSHLMRYLASWGVRRFVLCVGYRAEAIVDFTRTATGPGWQVTCVDSGDASMTDRLLAARRYVPGPALVCYGDTIANVDLAALGRQHRASASLATLTVYPLRSPFGIVDLDGADRVRGFAEKPRLPHWINIGFLLCEPAALDRLRPRSDLPEFLDELVRDRLLGAYRHAGKHLTINTEKDRTEAEVDIIEFYTVPGEQGA